MMPILAPDTLPAEVAVVVLEPLDAYPWLREHGWYADGATVRAGAYRRLPRRRLQHRPASPRGRLLRPSLLVRQGH